MATIRITSYWLIRCLRCGFVFGASSPSSCPLCSGRTTVVEED